MAAPLQWLVLVSLLLLVATLTGVTASFFDSGRLLLENYIANDTKLNELVTAFQRRSDDDKKCLASLKTHAGMALKFLRNCTTSSDMKTSCYEPNVAVRLLDALPTKPAGLTRKGPFFFIGDYEMCHEMWTLEREPVHYCTLKATIQNIIPITTGVCIPATCRAEQMSKLWRLVERHLLPLLNDTVTRDINVTSVTCAGTGDVVASEWASVRKTAFLLAAFSILGLLAVGTLVDKWNRDGVVLLVENGRSRRRVSSQRSDRESCGLETSDEEEDVEEDVATSTLHEAAPPSIALTYRTPRRPRLSSHLLLEVLAAFSVRASLAHLFRNSTRDVKLANLLRVVSSFWIIFSHTCLFSLEFTDNIRHVTRDTSRDDDDKTSSVLSSVFGWKSFMLNSSLAVDTFLFLSACLAAFAIRKKLLFRGDEARIMSIFGILGHRCLRLLPALSLYVVFMTTVYNHLSDGPFWNTSGMFGTTCSLSTIWPHLTFLGNFFPSMCVPWLWYLSLDFQLYLTLPLVIYFLWKIRRGFLLVPALCAVCLIYRSLAYSIYTLPANMFIEMLSGNLEAMELSFKLLYTSPFSRAPPFLIGILTGWHISNVRQLGAVAPMTSLGLKTLAIALLIVSLFGPFTDVTLVTYLHAVVHRTVWATGLAILVTLAQMGHNFGVFKVLSGHRLVVLSRLSLGVYLSHEPILLFYLNSLRQPLSPSSIAYFMFLTLSIYILSLLAALLIAIVVEIPLLTLERKLLMRATTRRKMVPLGHRKPSHRERHVSFGETTEIDDELDSTEKTRQWLQHGTLRLEKGNILETSTSC